MPMRILVGVGSCPFSSVKTFWKTGMMNMSMNVSTISAKLMTTIG